MNAPPNHGSSKPLSGSWRVDPRRSTVEFRVAYLWGLLAVKGHFDDYTGRLDMGVDPAVELTIDAASVQTGNRRRDAHLRSADFLDAEQYPRVRFVSDAVVLQGDTLKVKGRLIARDRSIPLELEAQIHNVDGELEIEATTATPHRELGMTYSPLGMISPHSTVLVRCRLIPDPHADTRTTPHTQSQQSER
jgi:polyisoprenoid-binding protein YceI